MLGTEFEFQAFQPLVLHKSLNKVEISDTW